MKPSLRLALIAVAIASVTGLVTPVSAQKVDFPQASPSATLKQRVGLTDIQIEYSRPGVKGRKIFGGLEPYGKVWRTGANSATKLTFSTPVKLGGTDLPAGAYELFTIPGESEWTVIVHKNVSEWGAYAYDAKDDVARLTVKPVALAAPVETFTIEINQIRDESATLELLWENTLVPVPLQVDVASKVVPQIQAVMASDSAKKPYFQSALFYLDHNLDLKQALAWMDTAIASDPKAFYAYYHKARILAKLGDKAAAIATAEKSIAVAAESGGVATEEYTRLNRTLIASLK